MSVPCPVCGNPNRPGVKFCSQCGQTLLCPQCGAVTRPQARFCLSCGASLQPGAIPPPPPPRPQPGVTPASSLPNLGTGQLPQRAVLHNRYIISRKVGQGGMGAVYLAMDTHIGGKTWAIKEMSVAGLSTAAERQEAIDAFYHEATLLARLNHPNIPKVGDAFEEGGKHYLAMEFVEGQTLEALLAARNGQAFSEAQVRTWLLELCDVLGYLHRQSPPIIFRDLKPANIMVDQSGHVKLIDFGIARLFKPGQQKDTQSLGTTGYAAPEQYGRTQTDARSDIYALGATAYYLLTGRDPADSPFVFPPLRHVNPNVSAQLADTVMRAVEADPQRRWHTTGELVAQLGGSLPVPPTLPAIPTPPVGPGVQTPPLPVSVNRSKRPTTRLLLAIAELSNRQIAVAVTGIAVAAVVGIWVLGPILARDYPFLWNNVPGFAIVGPAAYSAVRRRGAAIAAHIPITLLGWLAWFARSGSQPAHYDDFFIGLMVSGLILEAGVWYLPRFRGKVRDEAWKREIVWLAGMAVAATIGFYYRFGGPQIVFSPVLWLGAALLGAAGWFLGDMVQEYLFLQKHHISRRAALGGP